ncbi:MAG: hypothetical protein U5Q44_15545 [Dehalococcoidia bacterium]|nr:hypothetical protein [Dehalococcoidia bacterium]
MAEWVVLVGGIEKPGVREQIAAAQQPRIDVIEMEERYGAELARFWLLVYGGANRIERRMNALGCRTLGASAWLAVRTAAASREHVNYYTTGEDIGIPLALALRLLRRRSRVVMRVEQITRGSTPGRQRVYRYLSRFALPRIHHALPRTDALAQELRSRACRTAMRLPSRMHQRPPPSPLRTRRTPDGVGRQPAPPADRRARTTRL